MLPRLWHTGVMTLAVLGLVLLWFREPVTTMLGVPLAGVVGWSLAAVWRWTLAEEGDPPPKAPSFAKALTAGTACVGMVGLVLHAPGWGLAAVALLGLSSPPLLRRLRPTRPTAAVYRAGATPPEAEDLAPDVLDLLSTLSDDGLCRAWRRSFVLLHKSAPDDRLSVVRLRAALLDEMTRRHPREVHTWLASGARAASGPDRYFSEPE